MSAPTQPIDRAAALFLARWLLGLLFFMAGWFKVFELGASQHASEFFVEAYRDSWIPEALLWALGGAIPFLELAAGALLLLGLRVREALFAVALILILVTYGHLLAEPMFDMTKHIFPRAVLTLFLLYISREGDSWSADYLLAKRNKES
jgi:uncharacterized membrane protein YphA (DoxX/SURF4 family)